MLTKLKRWLLMLILVAHTLLELNQEHCRWTHLHSSTRCLWCLCQCLIYSTWEIHDFGHWTSFLTFCCVTNLMLPSLAALPKAISFLISMKLFQTEIRVKGCLRHPEYDVSFGWNLSSPLWPTDGDKVQLKLNFCLRHILTSPSSQTQSLSLWVWNNPHTCWLYCVIRERWCFNPNWGSRIDSTGALNLNRRWIKKRSCSGATTLEVLWGFTDADEHTERWEKMWVQCRWRT